MPKSKYSRSVQPRCTDEGGAQKRTATRLLVFIGTLACISALHAQTINKQGRLLASNCFQCHGTNGQGPGFDSLAGETSAEIYKEMLEFRSGKEGAGSIMAKHAMGYTDAQLRLLSDYLGTQKKLSANKNN